MTDFDRAISFSSELERDKRARDAYARLTPTEKCRVLARASRIRSEENMRLYAMSLSDEIGAEEYF